MKFNLGHRLLIWILCLRNVKNLKMLQSFKKQNLKKVHIMPGRYHTNLHTSNALVQICIITFCGLIIFYSSSMNFVVEMIQKNLMFIDVRNSTKLCICRVIIHNYVTYIWILKKIIRSKLMLSNINETTVFDLV